eukprot:Skav219728  [mRNA]  locus=scaffold301:247892:249164:- [translate_table: standard]
MFSAAPSEQEKAVAKEIDIGAGEQRLEEVHELIQNVIDKQLEEEQLLGPEGNQRVAPGKYRRCAYDAPSAAKEEDASQQSRPQLPTYKELSLERWKICSNLSSAMLLLQMAKTNWDRVVKVNAVHGNPHKRALNRILDQHTTQGYPQTQIGENECEKPYIESVPDQVKRVQSDEVIFTVSVCDETDGSKMQEFDILGSQALYELKDAFHFVSDWMYDGPTRMHSGCMCIGSWLFSDRRHKASKDYAPDLFEHLCEHRPGFREVGGFITMDLLMKEMIIPFGVQCCYVRQGDIEHPMYFTNVRKFNPSCDCPFVESYPILTYMRTHYKRYCSACAQNQATWVVHGSSRVPVDPLYICYTCYNRFFKDKNGELLKPVDYTVFPYLHD